MEEFIKTIGAITAIFAIYKIVIEAVLARSKKHREEYQFAKDYIEDLNDPTVHRFVLEKGFRALTGSLYSVEEIKHLLSYSKPTQAAFLRASTKNIVEFNPTEEKYNWKGIYDCQIFRKVASCIFLVLYSISAFITIRPFLYATDQNVITNISMGILAVYFVIKHSDFTDTIKFMQLRN